MKVWLLEDKVRSIQHFSQSFISTTLLIWLLLDDKKKFNAISSAKGLLDERSTILIWMVSNHGQIVYKVKVEVALDHMDSLVNV